MAAPVMPHAGGDPDRHGKGGDAAGDDASCTNHCALTDGDTLEHGATAADPCAPCDMDGGVGERVVDDHGVMAMDGVPGRQNAAVGADEHPFLKDQSPLSGEITPHIDGDPITKDKIGVRGKSEVPQDQADVIEERHAIAEKDAPPGHSGTVAHDGYAGRNTAVRTDPVDVGEAVAKAGEANEIVFIHEFMGGCPMSCPG